MFPFFESEQTFTKSRNRRDDTSRLPRLGQYTGGQPSGFLTPRVLTL